MYENLHSHPLEGKIYGHSIEYSPNIKDRAKRKSIEKRKKLRAFYVRLIEYKNYGDYSDEKWLINKMKELYKSYGIDFLNEPEILVLIRKNKNLETFVKKEMSKIINKRGD